MKVILIIILVVIVAIIGFLIRSFQAVFIKKRIIKLGKLLGLSYAIEKERAFYVVNYGFLVGEFNNRIVEIRDIEPRENNKVDYSLHINCNSSEVDFVISKRNISIDNYTRIVFGDEIFDKYYYIYGADEVPIRKIITPVLRQLLLNNYPKVPSKMIVENNFLKAIDIGKWSDLPQTIHSNIDIALKVGDQVETMTITL